MIFIKFQIHFIGCWCDKQQTKQQITQLQHQIKIEFINIIVKYIVNTSITRPARLNVDKVYNIKMKILSISRLYKNLNKLIKINVLEEE